MIDLTDGLLNAYLDDELDPLTRQSVERAIMSNPGAKLRIERMREQDQFLRDAHPVPATMSEDPIAARILSFDEDAPAPRWPRLPKAASIAMTAMAAGLFGIVVGRLTLAPESAATAMQPSAILDVNVNAALSSTLSGADKASSPRPIDIAYTFKTPEGEVCRQFSTVDGEGVACRADGGWRLAAWDGAAQNPPSAYVAAGASSVIDNAVEEMKAGEALSQEDEKRLIDNGWRQ